MLSMSRAFFEYGLNVYSVRKNIDLYNKWYFNHVHQFHGMVAAPQYSNYFEETVNITQKKAWGRRINYHTREIPRSTGICGAWRICQSRSSRRNCWEKCYNSSRNTSKQFILRIVRKHTRLPISVTKYEVNQKITKYTHHLAEAFTFFLHMIRLGNKTIKVEGSVVRGQMFRNQLK